MELLIAFFAGAMGGNLAAWIFTKRRIGLWMSTLIGTFGGGLLFVVVQSFTSVLASLTGSSAGFAGLLSIIAMGVVGGIVAFVLLGWVAPQNQTTKHKSA